MITDNIYIARDHQGNLRIFLGRPILSPQYKVNRKVTLNYYGEEEIEYENTDEYLYDEWVNPIFPLDYFDLDQRRFGFVVSDEFFTDDIKALKHEDEPKLISTNLN